MEKKIEIFTNFLLEKSIHFLFNVTGEFWDNNELGFFLERFKNRYILVRGAIKKCAWLATEEK